MQSFEIQLLEDRFQVEPLENGLYRIMESENKLGVIYAEAEGNQVKCSTRDELEDGFVQQVGELITEHNMRNPLFCRFYLIRAVPQLVNR